MATSTIANIDYAANGDDYNNIVLRGDPAYRESLTDEIVTPGALVEFNADGTVGLNSTQNSTNANRAFALEDSLQGNDIRDDYADGDLARWATFSAGDQVLAILLNDTTANGALLGSNGDGTLKVWSAGVVIGQQLYKYTDSNSVVRAVIQVF